MRWPWVSRLAYDLVVEERDWLREERNALIDRALAEREQAREERNRLVDHLARMDRIEHGVSEVPRQLRPGVPPMPDRLKAYIAGFAGARTQKTMRDAGYKRAAAGESWEEVMADVLDSDDDEDDDA